VADPPVHATAGTVRLPGFGPVNKKTLIVATVVGGGVLAYVWVRRAQKASLGTGTPAAGATDPNLDPATGFDYGTPQDLAAQGGSQGFDPFALDSGLGLGGAAGAAPAPVPAAPAPVTTNAEWEQECIANLQDGGVSQATVSNAESGLPRYLAHLTLNDQQATAVQLAVGLTGQPPSGGPFSIRRAPGPPPPKPGTHVKVPDVVGLEYAGGAAIIHAAGLKPHQEGPGRIVQQHPAAETTVTKGSTVVLFGANK